MITFANAALLAEYLRRAEHAHKVSGAADTGWSDWYARFIFAAARHNPNEAFLPGDTAPTTLTDNDKDIIDELAQYQTITSADPFRK